MEGKGADAQANEEAEAYYIGTNRRTQKRKAERCQTKHKQHAEAEAGEGTSSKQETRGKQLLGGEHPAPQFDTDII